MKSEYRPGIHRYEGGFRDGMYHGQGDMTWPDGTRYEGGFRAGDYHGQGVRTYKSGKRYEGSWDDGMFDRGRVHVAERAARHVLLW